MGYSEFPHTTYAGDSDMTEFIRLYEQLVADYSGTLNTIQSLSSRLDSFMSSMNTNYNTMVNVTIPNRVSSTVETALVPFENKIADLKSKLDGYDEKLNTLKTANAGQHTVLSESISNMNTALRELITGVEAKIEQARIDLKTEIAANSAFIQGRIAQEKELVEKRFTEVDAYIRTEHLAAEERAEIYTDEQIRRLRQLIDNISATTDKAIIDWMWNNAVNYGGYSAKQWYMDTYVKCEDFDMSCLDFYIRGREMTNWFDRRTYIYSPFTGKLTSTNDVLLQVVDFIKNTAITAVNYDSLDLTSDEYDSKKIEAFDYDFKGKEILTNA